MEPSTASGGSDNIYYTQSGNVGIGVGASDTIGAKLQVNPQYKQIGLIIRNGASGSYAAWTRSTPGSYSYTVPSGISYVRITAYGAGSGGLGGMAQATINVTAGETLYVYVGGQNGWNGGGAGGSPCGNTSPGQTGAGASDVRRGGVAPSNRIIVAGGSGGLVVMAVLTVAVGLVAGAVPEVAMLVVVEVVVVQARLGGTGGTQISGGAGDGVGTVGGNGGCSGFESSGAGGGGGGGYYGGNGGSAGGDNRGSGGGGGGSGYVTGSNTSMQSGVQSGNGKVIIEPLLSGSDNVMEWQNESGSPMSAVDVSGNLALGSSSRQRLQTLCQRQRLYYRKRLGHFGLAFQREISCL